MFPTYSVIGLKMEAKIREIAKYSTILEKSHPRNRSAIKPDTRYAMLLYLFGNIFLKQLNFAY
jgi:hypothetical protein